ncbi:copper homeostasis protein CutC [Sphingomonas fuzhouensis]|uniref:copper homeostasis protein CutC n=1 Tax=Sphingomonas fuzhouensis TaxID=3106033 RepID=UPI002AFE604A|nr:copper homeostasis protein CutC [Sphingomonas sp. SGZ-02]
MFKMVISPVRRGAALLEICVDDADGVAAVVAAGADRIELCGALGLGGLTPSAALVAHAVASGVPVHAMVRPRDGDFRFDDADIALATDEIRRMVDMGVAGVVVGAMADDDRLDLDVLARWRDAAAGLAIVLHRAVDLVADPVAAVEAVAGLGYDHVLTSGGAATAEQGAAVIAEMVEAARGRLSIIAGSGVSAENVAALIARTGVDAVHASASVREDWVDSRVPAMGFAVGPRRRTSADRIAAIRREIGEG